MKRTTIVGGLLTSVCAVVVAHAAGNQELHNPPYDFLMGNHIDTHLESMLRRDGSLFGRLYIYFTGEVDDVTGLPVAHHPRGAGEHNEECGVDAINCVVGWHVRALPAEAVFISHGGVNGHDHPVWLINGRNSIPQPGSYTHFHWITSMSSDARWEEVPEACDVGMAGMLEGHVVTGDLTLEDHVNLPIIWDDAEVHIGGGAENLVCPGWLLELKAIREFAFHHGGETIAVSPGIDNRTHLNIVTNYAIVPGIAGHHHGGGGHGDDGNGGGH
jgi:hypothetical protein